MHQARAGVDRQLGRAVDAPRLRDARFGSVFFRNYAPILLVVAFAIGLRVAYLALLRQNSPTFDLPEGGDSIFYDRVAQGENPGRAHFHSPLYQWFLASLYAAFGRDLTLVRALQHLLGVGTALLVYASSLVLFRRRGLALAAGLLQASFGPGIFYEGHLLVDAILPFTSALAVLSVVLSAASASVPLAFFAGAAVGLAALGRANALIWLPLALGALAWWRRSAGAHARRSRFTRPLALVVGAALSILPATLENVRAETDIVWLTSNAGLNLYIGNNPRARGAYNHPDEMWFRPGDPKSDFAGAGAARPELGQDVSSAKLSRWWRDQALDYMLENPLHTFRLAAKKLGLLLSNYEYPQLYNYYAYHRVVPLLGFLPTAGFIVAPALAGLVLALGAGRKRLRLFAGLALGYGLTFVPFFVVGRYRAAWVPCLTPLAAYACFEVGRRARVWARGLGRQGNAKAVGRAGGPLASCLLLAAAASLTLLPVGQTPKQATQFFSFAEAAAASGEPERAEAWCRAAIADAPTFAPPYPLLADSLLAVGRSEEARVMLERAAIDVPSSAAVRLRLGTLLLERGEVAAAEHSFRQAVAAEPQGVEAWIALTETLFAQSRVAEARLALTSAAALAPGAVGLPERLAERFDRLETQLAAEGVERRDHNKLK